MIAYFKVTLARPHRSLGTDSGRAGKRGSRGRYAEASWFFPSARARKGGRASEPGRATARERETKKKKEVAEEHLRGALFARAKSSLTSGRGSKAFYFYCNRVASGGGGRSRDKRGSPQRKQRAPKASPPSRAQVKTAALGSQMPIPRYTGPVMM